MRLSLSTICNEFAMLLTGIDTQCFVHVFPSTNTTVKRFQELLIVNANADFTSFTAHRIEGVVVLEVAKMPTLKQDVAAALLRPHGTPLPHPPACSTVESLSQTVTQRAPGCMLVARVTLSLLPSSVGAGHVGCECDTRKPDSISYMALLLDRQAVCVVPARWEQGYFDCCPSPACPSH
jgi:hypothetical protein